MAIDPKLYQELLEVFKGELTENYQALVDTLLQVEAADAEGAQTHLHTLFRLAHNIKGAARSVALDNIATLAHQLEDRFSQWREKKYKPSKAEINACLKEADQLLDAFNNTGEQDPESSEILKIPLDKINQANAKADEFLTYRLQFEHWSQEMQHILAALTQLEKDNKTSRSAITKMTTTLHKELQAICENSEQFLGNFSRSLTALQDNLRNMRLVPIATILTPLKRTARELADDMQKQISFATKGDDFEIDKMILDLIKDPLQHILRNAIDHGIEPAAEREKLGKPASGKIQIAVQQSAGKINLIFSDDGRGINLARVKQIALDKGLVTQEALKSLTEQDILQFILRPGFSTSQTVTEVSGRGVGLDVVHTNLEKAKGTLKIASTPNKGTRFTLTLPLTLATTRGLFVTVDQYHFMLPTLLLDSLYEIRLDQLTPVEGELVLQINDKPVPVKFLKDLLNLTTTAEQNLYRGIMLHDRGRHFIILVDTIDDEHDCVIKPFPIPFNQMELYIGVTLTGLDKLVLALNPKVLLQLAEKQALINRFQPKADEQGLRDKRILVVDDSLTTRTLAVNALEAAGYQVASAGDGKAAWELIQEKNFDCVVTDVEMPNMDGFKLTQLIKASEQYQNIPIIIVSAHETEAEKEQGINSGADAYLVKSQFNTLSLIEKIETLL